MQRFLLQRLTTHLWWKQRRLSHLCLLPFTWVYQCITALRRFCYKIGLKKTTRFPLPVIVVGNLTVGGTGKTPLVIWLCHFLRQQGWHPGVVSRGYGGNYQQVAYSVIANTDPTLVGDEPVLIARQTGCPLVVARRRSQAVAALVTQGNCDVIISDDGLQHYALGRDVEIVVIDGQRRLGNELCLPAGPLREAKTRLKTADFTIINGSPAAGELSFTLLPGKIYNLLQPHKQWHTNSAPLVHAVAGIGNPQRFFTTLKQMGFELIEHAFPDHYAYSAQDLQFADAHPILMTEKDAIKCQAFASENMWCLPVLAQPDKAFIAAFTQCLAQLRARN